MELKILRDENRTFTNLLFLGDIHGNFNLVDYLLKQRDLKDTIIIQVGDFGVGFKPKQERHVLKILSLRLARNNNVMYAIRGNHDDPAFFTNEWIGENICLVDDWTILELNIDGEYQRIFCFGGAISIDRLDRKKFEEKWKTKEWWPDEIAKFNDELVGQVKDIDIIVTHTAPEWCEPYMFNGLVYKYAAEDLHLLENLQHERRQMSYMFDVIYDNNRDTLKKHYYGHFHFKATGEYKGVITKLLDVGDLCSNSY